MVMRIPIADRRRKIAVGAVSHPENVAIAACNVVIQVPELGRLDPKPECSQQKGLQNGERERNYTGASAVRSSLRELALLT
jgi:hypothetical protein